MFQTNKMSYSDMDYSGHLIKPVHFLSRKRTCLIKKWTQIYMKEIVKLHIVSDETPVSHPIFEVQYDILPTKRWLN